MWPERRFHERFDAGRMLAEHLRDYAGQPDVLVLALPRGGVPVGYEVARALAAPLDVFVVRKLGVPGYEARRAYASARWRSCFRRDLWSMESDGITWKGMRMTPRMVTLPELGMIAMTRAAFGAGVGLLLADRLSNEQRRAVGWTLVAVGAISTIPLFAEVVLRHPSSQEQAGDEISRRARAASRESEREAALTRL